MSDSPHAAGDILDPVPEAVAASGAAAVRPRSRLSRRWRGLAPRLVFEGLLIVISILLALAAAQWREERQRRVLVSAALANVAEELERNAAAIEDVLPYHREVLANLRGLVERPEEVAGIGFLELVERAAPRGVQPPLLHATAWETVAAQGLAVDLPFATSRMLATTYDAQRAGAVATWQRIADRLFDPATFDPGRNRETLWFLFMAVNELQSQEAQLLVVYERALAQLRAGEGDGGER